MKAEITSNGTLIVISESAIESYALRKWGEENQGGLPAALILAWDCEKAGSAAKDPNW